MNKSRIPLNGGEEYDALTGAKQFFSWSPGQRRLIKRGYNKRFRRWGKSEVKNETVES